MLQSFSKVISLLFFALVFIPQSVWAETAHINYTSATSNHYTNIKGHLEDMGFTVTGTNSGSISLSDFTGKDLHINIAGSSNCGSTCKTAYETYIGNGGTVIIAGDGGATNRNGNIEQLVESKLSVGTITIYGTSSSSGYVSYASGSQYSLTGSSNQWGVDLVFNMNSGGTAIALNNSTYETWAVYDYGSNGGKLIITFDQDQFNMTGTNETRVFTFVEETLEEEGILSQTSTVTITSSQSTSVTTAQSRTITGNSVRITQSGANLDLDIVQSGDNNFIEGTDWSSRGTLTGDNLNITLEQGSDSLGSSSNNGIGIDVDGNTNTVMIRQGTMGSSDTGGHRAKLKVDGDTNSVTLYQYNDGATDSGHYGDIDVLGSSNTITAHQRNNSDKVLFIDLDGSSNTLTLDQKNTGNHYLDIDVNGNSHTITTTQQGSGDHGARISVTNSGGASTVTLDQNSSTNQNYTLTQDCTNSSGCSTSVTQN